MIAKTFAAILVASGLTLAAIPASSPVFAQEDMTLSPKQVEDVRKIVREYLMGHPEVLGEALEALREKMRLQAESEARKMVDARKDDLLKNTDDPVAGNAKGDVAVVEFFDYNCGFCKQTYDVMFEAMKADGKVRLVFKEYPILGPDSVIAARVALVAKAHGKYDDMHRAFMKFRGRLDEKAIFRIAGEVGLNIEQVKKEMTGPEIDRQLKKNLDLAHALDIGGTPTFIIGDRLVSSALDQPTFRQLIDLARRGPAPKG
ncbi:MAG: DsbA family protein [Magnetospirillum sp.]|nr:DsbA family protein [Magnetospirillum sp.]